MKKTNCIICQYFKEKKCTLFDIPEQEKCNFFLIKKYFWCQRLECFINGVACINSQNKQLREQCSETCKYYNRYIDYFLGNKIDYDKLRYNKELNNV